MIRKLKFRQCLLALIAAATLVMTSTSKVGAAEPYAITSVQNDLTFATTFSGNPLLNGSYLFDIELWNASNQRVFQQWETQNLSGTPSVQITKNIPNLPNGIYTVRAGIFSPDWSTKYNWDAVAGTVSVGAVYGMSTAVGTSSLTTTYTKSLPYNGTYLYDIELWNSSGNRVWQQWDTKTVGNDKSVSITKAIPSGLANGTYSIRGGIFSSNWSTRYLWTDTSGSLTVNGGTVVGGSSTTTSSSTTSSSTTSSSTTSSTSAPTTTTTSPVQLPTYTIASTVGPTTFDTKFTSSVNFNGTYLFDVELWDSSGNRVWQQYAPQTVTGTKTVTVTKTIPTLPPGAYSIRAGLFSPDWLTKYLWTDAAGTLIISPSGGGDSGGTPPGTAAPAGYKNLVFSDEFNGNALDTNKWLTCSPQMNYRDGMCFAHDGERQQYLASNVNIADFSDGSRGLRLSATESGKTWGNTRPNNVPYGSKMYNSGVISTGPNRFGLAKPGYQPFSFKYGYYEARMKMPKGQGYWPAAWSFPADGIGPYELDLVEVLGSDTTMADFSYHYPGGQTDEWYKTPSDMAAGFHTYGVDWQPDRIAWYFDGKLARSVFTNTAQISAKDAYLILNLAVGGNWPGPPDSATRFPGNFDIDYVRVWTK